VPDTPASLEQANAARAREAAARDAALARRVLDALGPRCSGKERAAVEARAAHPEESWSRIAARLGTTKDAAAGSFRRALRRTGMEDRQ
jgi:hypothetical protein